MACRVGLSPKSVLGSRCFSQDGVGILYEPAYETVCEAFIAMIIVGEVLGHHRGRFGRKLCLLKWLFVETQNGKVCLDNRGNLL